MAKLLRECGDIIYNQCNSNRELTTHNCKKPNSICILGYDTTQKFCIETDVSISVEDICIQCAKQLKITSNNVYLFGLVKTDVKTWLNSAQTLEPGEKNSGKYIFRLRYYSTSIIQENDLSSYLHKQCRNDFRNDVYPFSKEQQPKIFGFGINDIIIDSKEKNSSDSLILPNNFDQFFPKVIFNNLTWIKKLLLKKKIKNKVRKGFQKSNNLEHHRKRFVEDVYKLFSNHMCKETFECKILNDKVTVSVQRNDNSDEMCISFGISSYLVNSLRWIEIKSNNIVQLNFRQSSPIVLCFDDKESTESFVSCLDGHFRLAYDFYNSLCEQVEPPSIQFLREHGFHGNISKKYIADILRKKSHQPGCYLIQWNLVKPSYYYIASLNPNFNSKNVNQQEILYDTIKYDGKCYSLKESNETFPSITNLLEYIRSSQMNQMVKPDKFAISNLLLCKPESFNGEQETKRKHSQPEILSQSDIIFHREQGLVGSGVFTDVSLAVHKRNGNKSVVVKQLKDFTESPYYLQFFLNAIEDHYLLSKNSSFLQMEGIILKPKCGLVMEYATYKSVSEFLCRNKQVRVGLILNMAATVSDGLMYLRKQGLVHGNLHGHNLMLITMSQVKIADPALVRVTEHLPLNNPINVARKPWLAPELQNNLQKPTCESDMFAFGSCLCEMLCLECKPPQEDYKIQNTCKHVCRLLIASKADSENDNNTEQFDDIYKQVHSLILDCRAKDSECRPKPSDVSRTLLQLADKLKNEPLLKEGDDEIECKPVCDNNTQPLCNHKWVKQFSDPPPTIKEIKNLCSQVPRCNTSLVSSNPLEILKEDIENIRKVLLGKGAFGKVWKIIYKKNDERITAAFKEFSFMDQSSASLMLEFKILHKLHHERIIKMYGFCNNPSGIILEFIDGCDLEKWLKRNKDIMASIKRILIEIAEGMHYLQSENIIHLDLAARNILLTADTHVKITDFGLAKQINSEVYRVKSERRLPLCWLSPEVANNEITTKADVWSYGVLMWECFTHGEHPYLLNVKFDKEEYRLAWRNSQRLPKPENCSGEHFRLMNECWKYKPQDRPNFDSIIQSLKSLHF